MPELDIAPDDFGDAAVEDMFTDDSAKATDGDETATDAAPEGGDQPDADEEGAKGDEDAKEIPDVDAAPEGEKAAGEVEAEAKAKEDEPPPEEAEKAEGEKAEAAPPDEEGEPLPDDPDLTVRDRKGKREWVYTEERGRLVYGGYKRAQAAEKILNEEITEEVIQSRENAFRDSEDLRLDFISGKPDAQADVFRHLLKFADNALTAGEIGADPIPAAAETFLHVLGESNPVAFEAAERVMLRRALDGMYATGKKDGDKNLFYSAAHIDRKIFNSHKGWDEFDPAQDQLTQRETAVSQRETALHEAEGTRADQNWTAFTQSAGKSINESVEGAIDKELSQVAPVFKEYPERFKNIRVRLQQEIRAEIQGDAAWRKANEQLYQRASLAVSERVRDEIREQLAKRYAAKATTVVKTLKGKLISEESHAVKAASDAKRKRRDKAQGKTGRPSGGTPVQEGLPKEPTGLVGSQEWAGAVDKMFAE